MSRSYGKPNDKDLSYKYLQN